MVSTKLETLPTFRPSIHPYAFLPKVLGNFKFPKSLSEFFWDTRETPISPINLPKQPTKACTPPCCDWMARCFHVNMDLERRKKLLIYILTNFLRFKLRTRKILSLAMVLFGLSKQRIDTEISWPRVQSHCKHTQSHTLRESELP